jgi:hypothetical protein
MPLLIDAFNKLVKVTSPTTAVDAQTLHDFVEDYLASPVGMVNDGQWPGSPAQRGDILKPEGKIEDPSNPGVFSQIILILHPQWQIQFWGGSGYTRIFGGKIVGGVADQPLLATGTAGDISVLESPVDGITTVVETGVSGLTAAESAQLAVIDTVRKLHTNRLITDPGTGILTIYDDDDIAVLFSGNIYEDALAAQLYQGRGLERRNKLT